MSRSFNQIETEILFERGDYTAVALKNDQSKWQTFAAFGIIGKTQLALQGLAHFQNIEAKFYSAVTYWIGGHDNEALSLLSQIQLPHAQNLAALIQKPRINILAQLPYGWTPQHLKDPKFQIKQIESGSNELYTSIHQQYSNDLMPDFYFAQMIEWHDIAPDIQELPCPIFGVTADYDAHIHGVYPWLKVFDELVAPTPSEWADLNALSDKPVSTFPKVYGSDHPFQDLEISNRDTDVFISGTTLHPYFPDKTELFHRLLEAKDLNLEYVIGFTPDYFEKLKQTKATFTYVRRPYGIPTRGIEALCMGCAVVAQEESALFLYAGENEGVISYNSQADLTEKLRHIKENWNDFSERARKGSTLIRQEFSLDKVFSQYMRFLAFLAAKPRAARIPTQQGPLLQKENFFVMGRKDRREVRELRKMHHLSLAQASIDGSSGPSHLLDAARDVALECARAIYPYAASQYQDAEIDRTQVELALQLYQIGAQRYPEYLAFHFNMIRFGLHCGNSHDATNLIEHALKVLNAPRNCWKLDPLDDIFPLDFFRAFFNYRTYLEKATNSLICKEDLSSELIQHIMASLHCYVGNYWKPLEHYQKAYELDPGFAFYKFKYAESLIQTAIDSNNLQSIPQAGALLIELCDSSHLFIEAFEILERLTQKGLFHTEHFQRLHEKMQFFYRSGSITEGEDWVHTQLKQASTIIF